MLLPSSIYLHVALGAVLAFASDLSALQSSSNEHHPASLSNRGLEHGSPNPSISEVQHQQHHNDPDRKPPHVWELVPTPSITEVHPPESRKSEEGSSQQNGREKGEEHKPRQSVRQRLSRTSSELNRRYGLAPRNKNRDPTPFTSDMKKILLNEGEKVWREAGRKDLALRLFGNKRAHRQRLKDMTDVEAERLYYAQPEYKKYAMGSTIHSNRDALALKSLNGYVNTLGL